MAGFEAHAIIYSNSNMGGVNIDGLGVAYLTGLSLPSADLGVSDLVGFTVEGCVFQTTYTAMPGKLRTIWVQI